MQVFMLSVLACVVFSYIHALLLRLFQLLLVLAIWPSLFVCFVAVSHEHCYTLHRKLVSLCQQNVCFSHFLKMLFQRMGFGQLKDAWELLVLHLLISF